VLRDVANVERCQVDSVDADPICITQSPEILDQDLSILTLSLARLDDVEQMSGVHASTLDDYLEIIDGCFERFAKHAVAVKCQWAYNRPLGVQALDAPPRRAFEHLRAGKASPEELRQVQDFAFRRCLDLATSHGLPVKLHLGYLGGTSRPELRHLRDHVRDMVGLAQSHPHTTFVLMHMGLAPPGGASRARQAHPERRGGPLLGVDRRALGDARLRAAVRHVRAGRQAPLLRWRLHDRRIRPSVTQRLRGAGCRPRSRGWSPRTG
jgi:hypothetical protein